MKILQQLLLFGIILLFTACGNKGPVRPLEAPLPGPATALELRQRGDALLLGWQLPIRNLDGSAIKSPPQLDLYRMTYDPENDCPECFDRSSLLARIDPELPEPARKIGGRYQYFDYQVQPGIGYQYKLVARNADNQSGQTVILRQSFTKALAAPVDFQARGLDRSVSLNWLPVKLAANEELLGYRIYRRLDGAENAPALLNAEPLKETRFEDFNLDNGTRYHYRIRALIKRDDQQIEGLATPELTVVPESGI